VTDEPKRVPPPGKHQLALMIWLCVFPTLTIINVALGGWLRTMTPVTRTFVLATVAVPIVVYGLMPHLHRARARLLRGSSRLALVDEGRGHDPDPVAVVTQGRRELERTGRPAASSRRRREGSGPTRRS
jgi:hypothetical protein